MEGQNTNGHDQELSIDALNAIAPETPRRKRRLVRFALWTGGAMLLLVLLAAALAPTAAGWFVPGAVAGAIQQRIRGSATVDRVSLAWFGSQQVGPVVVKDEAGVEVARLDIAVSRGLWGLGLGAVGLGDLDAGEISIAGKAMIVREPDGTLNVQKLLKPSPPAAPSPPPKPGEPVQLPDGLAASLIIDKVDVTFVDKSASAPPGAEAIRIANIKGGGQIAAGKPATFKLSASAWYGPSETATTAAAGTLNINATVDKLIDSTSRLTPEQARFDVTVEARDMSIVLADAFAGTKDAMSKSFGERLTLALKAGGTAGDATADLTASAQGFSADLGFRYADSVLTASRAGTLRARTAGIVPLVPELADALAKQNTAEISTWPEVTVAIQSLRMKLPAGGAPVDLRGGSLALSVKSTELLGTIVAPALDETEGSGVMSRRAFRLAPLTLTVNAPDLEGPVKIHADTAARLSDSSAGSLQLDVTAEGLLDDHGAPVTGPPGKLNGRLVIKEIATALGQPLVEAMGLDLPRDLGPRLDVVVAAAARAEESAAGGPVPRTHVDVTVRSGKLQSTAALLLDETGLRGRDMPDAPAVQITLASASQILARLINQSGSGARAAGQGPLTIAVTGLHVPLAEGTRSPDLASAAATAAVSYGGLTVTPPAPARAAGGPAQPAAAPIAVEKFGLTASLVPGKAPQVGLDSAMSHAGTPFALKGSWAIEGLFRADPAGKAQLTPDAALPVGSLTLEGVPTALASLMPRAPAQPGQPAPPDIARLIQDAVGPSISVSLETVIAEARSDRLNFRLNLDSAGVKGRVNGGLLPDRVDLARSEVRATLAPALAESVLAAYAPTLTPRPRLGAPSTLVIAIEPTRLPFIQGRRYSPDFAGAGELNAKVTLDGRLIVEGLALTDAEGKPRDIGPAALQGFEAAFSAPLAALMAPGKSGPASFTLKSDVLAGAPGAELTSLGRLDVDAKLELAGGAPTGPAAATVKLADFTTAQIDRILAQPGLLAGALGPTVSLDAAVEAELPRPGSAAAEGGPAAPPFERLSVTATPASEKLKTERPLKAVVTPERIAVDSPMVLAWTMDPGFADRFILGLDAAPPRPPPPGTAAPAATGARFAEPTQFRIALYRLGLAAGAAPMKPGIFGADVALEAPGLLLTLPDGAPAKFSDFKLRAQAGGEGQQPGAAGFSLRMMSETSPVDISGGLYGLHDETGVPTPEATRLTARVNATAIPTAIVDGLGRQGGLLVEALGPTMTLEAEATGVSQAKSDRGKLTATFNSPRATAKLAGNIGEGVFVAQGPITVELTEITTALGQRLVKGLPMIGSFEKRAEDGAAAVTATNLHVPVDGDLSKLNGEVVLNLGMVRFDTSKTLAGLLRGMGQREQGVLGRRVAPFRASFKDGVMSYEKYTLPLGEFSVDIRGEVDFANRALDIITYIPLGALSDEAAGAFNTGLGSAISNLPVLDKATMLPFRTRGSFDDARTTPAPAIFVKEFGGTLNPLNILKPDRDGGAGGGGGGGK